MKIEDIDTAFRKALNRQGYGFHYSAIQSVKMMERSQPYWHVVVAEFGVEVRGRDTRVDIILQKGMDPFYLLVECKRVNPAVGYWCFARTPWPNAKHHTSMSFVEVLNRSEEGDYSTNLERILPTDRAYQVALEIRTGQKGDSSGGGRGAIEESLGQVCRGLNGFLEFLASRNDIVPKGSHTRVLPVVFTTAKLFVSQVEIGSADLLDGDLKESMGLKECDWVWLDYSQSPGLKHSISHKPVKPGLAEVFYSEFMRRVAIVSASGIKNFLRSQMWDVI